MKAYVIMPYGGDDQAKAAEYNMVYFGLIKAAVSKYDKNMDVQRQDYTSEGGHIMRNVISNIAESDLVIADLSDQNWNVAYELGLRHVMRKFGTILMCSDQTQLPYDIEHLNVLIYPADWKNHFEETTDQIAAAIRRALAKERPDSPVFDIFSALPDNLTEMLSSTNDEEQKRLMELNEELKAAKEETERLRRRIEDAGLNEADVKEDKDLVGIFRTAVKNRIYNSDAAVAKLRELEQAQDYEGFADFLAKVLQNGFLDETDCLNITRLCRRMNVPDITRTYLETVINFYPENEELRAYLADEYSQDYHNRDRALSLVNESLGIRRKDGRYDLTKKTRSARLLAAMFNVYVRLKKYDDVIEIGNLLLQTEVKNRSLVLRNMTTAYLNTDQYEEAGKCVDLLIETDPRADLNYHTQFKYLATMEDYKGAYQALEKCISLEPSDSDYYFIIAGHICDEHVARVPETCAVETITHNEWEKYAAPFIVRAFMQDPRACAERSLQFCSRNGFSDTREYLAAFIQGKIESRELLDHFDFRMVDYCTQDD
ncbi:MAG: tetratricopeptide repeat protein [Lachnospiraceae bacterium]|nr:tetratricopeptide repeat protein [Lachnospiraceae bacterium]